MRHLARSPLVLLVAVLSLGVAAPAWAVAGGSPPASGDLQRRADVAGRRYAKAEVALANLGDRIAGLERKISDTEAAMAPLRAALTRRAVAVYTSDPGFDVVAGFAGGTEIVESARGAKLAADISARDAAVLSAAAVTSADLARRRDELASRRADQQRALDALATERHNVEQALAFMTRREQAGRPGPDLRASRGERISLEEAPPAAPIRFPTDFVCPVQGPKTFTDTWGAPRGGGRHHEGTDIMNAYGTPNVAVVPGDFETHHSGLGGLSIYLHGDDGNTYYYAHLSRIVGADRRVAQGEVIGLTGSSGDATTPHTHFEFHPGGGRAVDSYPLVRAHC